MFNSVSGTGFRILIGIFASANLATSSIALAQDAVPSPSARTGSPAAVKALAVKRDAWRRSLHLKPAQSPGCYTATFPNTKWTRVACDSPPPNDRVPQAGPPNFGQSDNIVAAGGSVSSTKGSIANATGTFFDAFGVTQETVASGPNNGLNNVYSLQMNTNNFVTKKWCTGAQPANCNGFEQFLFVNNDSGGPNKPRISYVYIFYVLNNYGSSCPPNWTASNGACYLASERMTGPVLPLSSFSSMTLTGGTSGGNDYVIFSSGSGKPLHFTATGSVLGLSNWNQVQFNVFGDASYLNSGPGQGAQANFGPGSTMQVTTSINAQPGLSVTCSQNSFTAETANLAAASACSYLPAPSFGITFVQGTPPIGVVIAPQKGPSNGDTSISITGVGFTPTVNVSLGGIRTRIAQCDTTTHCTATVPPGVGAPFNVQVANVSPTTNVPGVYSAPSANNAFSYVFTPPCSLAESCTIFQDQPPTYSVTCAIPSDFYAWSGTPVDATTPPPSSLHFLMNGTSDSGTTTDQYTFVAACNPGTTDQCTSFSTYVPVSNYCKSSGGGGQGGGGTVNCKTCVENGGQCVRSGGKTICQNL